MGAWSLYKLSEVCLLVWTKTWQIWNLKLRDDELGKKIIRAMCTHKDAEVYSPFIWTNLQVLRGGIASEVFT